ncbi:Hypothetical predicted protein, partial [Pelobates cultripes]
MPWGLTLKSSELWARCDAPFNVAGIQLPSIFPSEGIGKQQSEAGLHDKRDRATLQAGQNYRQAIPLP